MKKQQKLIICAVILVTLIVVSALIYKKIHRCDNSLNEECLMKLFEQYGVSGCDSYTKNRYYCYREFAIMEDVSACGLINFSEEKIPAKYEKDDCYANAAKVKKDPTLCENVQNQFIRAGCFEDFNIKEE